MDSAETGNDKVPLSAHYVAGSTYPAEICVLRYALQRNARFKPDQIFAAFEGGERWTFAQTLQQVESLAGNLHELGVRQGDHVVLVLPTSSLALRVKMRPPPMAGIVQHLPLMTFSRPSS